MFNKNYFNSSVGLDLLRSDLASTIIQSVCDHSKWLHGDIAVYDNTTIKKLIDNITLDEHAVDWWPCDDEEPNKTHYKLCYLLEHPSIVHYYIMHYQADSEISRIIVETFLNYFNLEMDFDFDYNFATFHTCNIDEAIRSAVFGEYYCGAHVYILYDIINSHKIEHHHSTDNSDIVINDYESLKNYSNLCRMLDSDPSVHNFSSSNDDVNIISKMCDHYGWAFAVPSEYGISVRYKKHCGLKDWFSFCTCDDDIGYYDDETDTYIVDEYAWYSFIEYIKEYLDIDCKVVLLTGYYSDNSVAA